MPADFLVDLALSVLFTVLKASIKNPDKKAQLKKALLKLRDSITAAYPGE